MSIQITDVSKPRVLKLVTIRYTNSDSVVRRLVISRDPVYRWNSAL